MENFNSEDKNQSAFRKDFCTVTPFSRFVAALVLIISPFIGFFLGIQYSSETGRVSEPLIAEVSIKPSVVEDLWYYYRNPAGFSVMVPKKATLIENEKNIFITTDEVGKADPIGYEIHFRRDVKNDEEAIQFGHDVWGSDCIVEPESRAEDVYDDVKYYVYRPNMDVMPDEADYGNCVAGKGVELVRSPISGLALSWERGFGRALANNELVNELWAGATTTEDKVYYYDTGVLDSISFTYEQ